jgi:hypothetical protein
MIPKEKAEQLFNKFNSALINEIKHNAARNFVSFNCVLIAVDEILNLLNEIDYDTYSDNAIRFYNEVKQEIEKL